MLIHTPNPSTRDTVTRPVANSVIRELIDMLGIDPTARIIFAGDPEQTAQAGSTLSDASSGATNFWPDAEKVIIEVSESSDEQRAFETAVFQREQPPVFADPRIGVRIWPIKVHTEMVISFQYQAANKTRAEQWRDDIRVRYSQGRVENLHEITYNYGIPAVMVQLLNVIGAMKENVAGYGETIQQWIDNFSAPYVTNVTNVAGNGSLLTVAETQEMVLGWFDFELEPQPLQKGNETGPWIGSFEYRIAYDKPVECAMYYPLVIHNQVIDEKYRLNYNTPRTLGQRSHYESLSRKQFNVLTPEIFRKNYTSMDWIRIPSYDDWAPVHTSRATANVATMLCTVDVNDPYLVLDLNDLGGKQIDPDVLNFLKGEGDYAYNYRQSVFFFALYESERDMPGNPISWGPDGIIRATYPLDLRKVYHLRWAAMTDLTMLTVQAQLRLCANGPAALKILMSLMGDEKLLIALPKLQNGQLTLAQLQDFAMKLNARRRGEARAQGSGGPRRTVGTYLITARNSNQLASR